VGRVTHDGRAGGIFGARAQPTVNKIEHRPGQPQRSQRARKRMEVSPILEDIVKQIVERGRLLYACARG